MNEWISVEDRKPPKGEILIYVAPLIRDRSYTSLSALIKVNDGIVYGFRTVTHWMPLPEPPKQQKGGRMNIEEQIKGLRRYSLQDSESSHAEGGDEIYELVKDIHNAADTLTKLNAVFDAAKNLVRDFDDENIGDITHRYEQIEAAIAAVDRRTSE